jgi:hypothetical protein
MNNKELGRNETVNNTHFIDIYENLMTFDFTNIVTKDIDQNGWNILIIPSNTFIYRGTNFNNHQNLNQKSENQSNTENEKDVFYGDFTTSAFYAFSNPDNPNMDFGKIIEYKTNTEIHLLDLNNANNFTKMFELSKNTFPKEEIEIAFNYIANNKNENTQETHTETQQQQQQQIIRFSNLNIDTIVTRWICNFIHEHKQHDMSNISGAGNVCIEGFHPELIICGDNKNNKIIPTGIEFYSLPFFSPFFQEYTITTKPQKQQYLIKTNNSKLTNEIVLFSKLFITHGCANKKKIPLKLITNSYKIFNPDTYQFTKKEFFLFQEPIYHQFMQTSFNNIKLQIETKYKKHHYDENEDWVPPINPTITNEELMHEINKHQNIFLQKMQTIKNKLIEMDEIEYETNRPKLKTAFFIKRQRGFTKKIKSKNSKSKKSKSKKNSKSNKSKSK